MPLSTQDLQDIIINDAVRHGNDPALMLALAEQESGFNPNALSPAGVRGLFQVTNATGTPYGQTPQTRSDPRVSSDVGQRHFKDLLFKAGGDVPTALRWWNTTDPQFAEKVQARVPRHTAARAPEPSAADVLRDVYGDPAAAPATTPEAEPSAADVLRDVYGDPAAPATPPTAPAGTWQQEIAALRPLTPAPPVHIDTDPTAIGRPRPSTAEGYQELAATGVQGVTTAGGALLGALAGPVTSVMGAGAGSLVGHRLNKGLGLTPGEWNEPVSGQDALAVGTPLVFETLSRLGTKIGNAVEGRFARPEDQRLVELAQAHGMNDALTYGDVRGNAAPEAVKRGTTLEAMGGSGASEIRVAGQAQAKAAAERFGDRTTAEMQQLTHDALPTVQAAAAAGDREAGYILGVVQQAGQEPGGVIKASTGLQMMQAKLHADTLYNEVERLAAPLGTVPPTQTLTVAKQALAKIDNATLHVDPTGAVRSQIERVISRLEPQTTTTPGQAGFMGTPPVTTTTLPSNDYGVMRTLRSELGEVASSPAMRDSRGAEILGDLRAAVGEDMRTFAASSGKPDLIAAQQQADAFYPTVVNQRALFRSVERLQPDQVGKAVVKRGQGDLAQTWFDALDEKGQAAVRADILQTALTDGPAPAIHPTTGLFSPARLAKNLEDARAATGVFFPDTGQGKWELNGFTNLMRHVERVGTYAENPPTGQRTLPLMRVSRAVTGAVAGAGVGGLPGAAVGLVAEPLTEAVIGRAATALFMTPAGRNFLLAASDLTPGSRAMTTLSETLAQQLPGVSHLLHGLLTRW